MDSETSKVEVELTATEKLAQFEKEKLSRRQALARFGFQAGAAAIAALTADDLLRKVGKEMKQRAGDNKVMQQVAREFEQAGVANALAARVCNGDTYPQTDCGANAFMKCINFAGCDNQYWACINAGGVESGCRATQSACYDYWRALYLTYCQDLGCNCS